MNYEIPHQAEISKWHTALDLSNKLKTITIMHNNERQHDKDVKKDSHKLR